MTTPKAETRTCGYPDCNRPTELAEPGAPGRPPEYCNDPAHTRGAAWRARRRRSAGGDVASEDARPVDTARQRASEIRGQVTGMAELLTEQLGAFLEELRTLADPGAAEAQLEAITSEAAERVAVAAAAASRAEQAQRAAESRQADADAAAAEATDLAEELQRGLEQAREQVQVLEQDREQDREVAEQDRAAAEVARLDAAALVEGLRQELAALGGRLQESERDRDAAQSRADEAAGARAAAEQQASASAERASAALARAEAAEGITVTLRADVTRLSEQREQAVEQVSGLRESLATANAQLAAALADVERERMHGDDRVQDLRTATAEELSRLRADLEQARAEAQQAQQAADAEPGSAPKGGRRGSPRSTST